MDHAAARKCGCQDVKLVTVGPAAGNVLRGEVTGKFGGFCSQVYQVAALRLSPATETAHV